MKLPQLTLTEKFRLLVGKNDWQTDDLDGKLPSVFLCDGPHGLRKAEYEPDERGNMQAVRTVKATAYPSLSAIGCSWSREAARLMGEGIADDCIENDVDVLLAPGVNMKRTPLCGRNFEYFSEDPYLSGELAYEYISGLQSCGVGASLKHFAANNAENYRHTQNSEMDTRALHELYFPAFRRALDAKPWTVMCSYNPVNGIYASENKFLLYDTLRKRFGFGGVIVSDWAAVHNRARAVKASLDLEMPHFDGSVAEMQEAYDAGFITDAEIDASVERLFALIEKAQAAKKTRKVRFSPEQRHANAVRIAEESIVLLKNEDNLLPLDKNAKIDVLDSGKSLRYGGEGSSKAEPKTPVRSIGQCLSALGCTITDTYGQYRLDVYGDVQIVTAGLYVPEGEGNDRESLRLDRTDEERILSVAQRNENVVVLLYAGSAVDVSSFIDKVKAVVYVGICGEGANEACAHILTGKVCPSGKLAETFPCALADCPVHKENEYEIANYYAERLMIGYRYYDTKRVSPQFPFGFGLSYRKFRYLDL